MIKNPKASTPLGESVVDEVRAIREAIDEEVGHDLGRLAELARRKSSEIMSRYGMKRAEVPAPPCASQPRTNS